MIELALLDWSLGIELVEDCEDCDCVLDGGAWLGVVSCANATDPASKHAAVRVRTFRIDFLRSFRRAKGWEVAYTVRYWLIA